MDAVLITKTVTLAELMPGMSLSEDAYSEADILLMTKDQRVTGTVVGRLLGFAERRGVRQPFRVQAAKS
ncbi:hypothetical protein [Halioxenophilus sp. WMMB6]|uniref:hypothetical protein n=1 Tax=Halioxenophilus sp. WMMB6 TaxID=3073815 RepID=UPI00295E269F|nr:hypothetical protein [Halioxenophilus sp. WMMB6]